jgi:hypothetical protein
MAQVSGFKNTQALPQRGKACSVSGFALLSLRSRNHARSAFKRFFNPLTFAGQYMTYWQKLRVFELLSRSLAGAKHDPQAKLAIMER